MKKRISAIISAAIVLGCLSGCSNGAETSDIPSESGKESSSSAPASTASAAESAASDSSESFQTGGYPYIFQSGVYGQAEIPDFPAKNSDKDGCIKELQNFNRGIDSLVIETHTLGDYTVKLVGKFVRTDEEHFPDRLFSEGYEAVVEKDGKTLGSARFTPNMLGQSLYKHEYRFFKDKIGKYIEIYDLEQPVIAMKYYYDDAEWLTDLPKAVMFATVTPENEVTYLMGDFGENLAVMWNTDISVDNPKEIVTNSDITAENPYKSDDDKESVRRAQAGVFSADEFKVADKNTLVDDKAGIRFSFDFSRKNTQYSARIYE